MAASADSKTTGVNRKTLTTARNDLKGAEAIVTTASNDLKGAEAIVKSAKTALDTANQQVAQKTTTVTTALAELNKGIQLQLNSFNAAKNKVGQLENAADTLADILSGKTQDPEKKLAKAIPDGRIKIVAAVRAADEPKLEKI